MYTPKPFWDWFLKGPTAGWRRFTNLWLLVHIGIGLVIALLVPATLKEAASTVLLPLAGVLVGMSFAWVGNALAIAQSVEIVRLSEHHQDGFEAYVHPFQAAILVLLLCLVGWGLAGLGLFDRPCAWRCSPWLYRGVAAALYGVASLAVRECWHLVNGAQLMLLYQRAVRRADDDRKV
jgi:hypothetical protein